MKRQILRNLLLGINLVIAWLILGKSIIDPRVGKVKFFIFPVEINLPEWKFVKSQSQPIPNSKQGWIYTYNRKDILLNIEINYLIRSNGHDIKSFLKKNPNIQPDIRYKSGVGYYIIFTHSEQALLMSCINSRGESTVTTKQFIDNRNTYDLKPTRIMPWLLGRENLRDRRCLLNQLSITLNENSPEEIYPILENTWLNWYQWWFSHFPSP